MEIKAGQKLACPACSTSPGSADFTRWRAGTGGSGMRAVLDGEVIGGSLPGGVPWPAAELSSWPASTSAWVTV